jgi:hypothetical protein
MGVDRFCTYEFFVVVVIPNLDLVNAFCTAQGSLVPTAILVRP